MGMPVQWNPCGNNTRFPTIRWYPAANSILEMVNAWPTWSEPFMYGYGVVPIHFGAVSRTSSALTRAVMQVSMSTTTR